MHSRYTQGGIMCYFGCTLGHNMLTRDSNEGNTAGYYGVTTVYLNYIRTTQEALMGIISTIIFIGIVALYIYLAT